MSITIKEGIYGSIIVALVIFGFWLGRQWDAASIERQLAAQKTQLIASCNKDKAITKEATHDLQSKYDVIAAKRAAERVRTACVPVAHQTDNKAGGNAEHAGQDGIDPEQLYDYAAECEEYRSEVMVLTGFQGSVWKANGQP